MKNETNDSRSEDRPPSLSVEEKALLSEVTELLVEGPLNTHEIAECLGGAHGPESSLHGRLVKLMPFGLECEERHGKSGQVIERKWKLRFE